MIFEVFFFTHTFSQVFLIHLELDFRFIIKKKVCINRSRQVHHELLRVFFFLISGRVNGTYKAISCWNVNSYLVLIPDKELHCP